MAACTTCGNGEAVIKGECRTCYMYRHRNGSQRPEGVILRKNIREFERERERLIIRQAMLAQDE